MIFRNYNQRAKEVHPKEHGSRWMKEKGQRFTLYQKNTSNSSKVYILCYSFAELSLYFRCYSLNLNLVMIIYVVYFVIVWMINTCTRSIDIALKKQIVRVSFPSHTKVYIWLYTKFQNKTIKHIILEFKNS